MRLTALLLINGEHLVDLLTNFVVGNLDIILGVTVVGHQGHEAILGDVELNFVNKMTSVSSRKPRGGGGTHELVLLTGDVGDIHVVGGGGEILKLLAGEDIGGDKVNLGVTVLSSLGGRHVNDLAGTVLDHNVAVLAQSRALHGESERGSGISRLEGDIVL